MNYNEEISNIQADMLNEMPDSYSKVKGNWLWEMFKAFSMKVYELLQLLTDTADKLNVENLKGDELDAYVGQWTDLTRKTAQRASGYIEVRGNGTIYSGTIVSNGTCQYEVVADVDVNGTATVPIVAVNPGAVYNTEESTVTVMVTSNNNVTSITNPEPIEGGADEETDEALRNRYYLRLQMPATSGNRAHYILWALECKGVGGAKATRDTKVNNKVNLYICGDNGDTADDAVIKTVQDHIDPNKNGDGSGCAPVGAICEVLSAIKKNIDIVGKVELDGTLSLDDVKRNIKAAILKYFSQINFKKNELSYARILHLALCCDGVSDITDFKLNDGYVNITCEETEIFALNSFNMEVEV